MNAAARLAARWESVPVWAMPLLIAGAVVFFLGLILLAIPLWGSIEKTKDERAALLSIRTIRLAELTYESIYPANGFACTLAALGGDPRVGAASQVAAQLIPVDLASGTKSGYAFSVNCTDSVIKNGIYRYNKFAVTAVPADVGKTGTRGFCGDQFGNIQYDPLGGNNCTQPIE
jgi:type IV pilus assembly protein PilA